MVEVSDKLDQLMVIKRNGKKVPFDETKIALAIKKGFDSVELDNDEDEKLRKYDSKDIQNRRGTYEPQRIFKNKLFRIDYFVFKRLWA